MKESSKDVTGIILAGGKSSRMGTDKGFIKYRSKYFITHIIEAMEPIVRDIIIVSDCADYDIFNKQRVEDEIKNAGPLAGVYTGLKHTRTAYNLIVSCDVPLIKTAVLTKLLEQRTEEAQVIQLQGENKTMPLLALYKKECEQKCLELLERGERRMKVAIAEFKTKTIEIEKEEWLRSMMNVNTPEDLKNISHGIDD